MGSKSAEVKVIVGEERLSVLTPRAGKLRFGETLIADSRILTVVVKLGHDLSPVAQFLDGLEGEVVHLGTDVGEPRRIGLIVGIVHHVAALPPGSSIIEMRVEVVIVASPELNVAF